MLSAYVDLIINVNEKKWHLQLQNGNNYDYHSYDCQTNTLSIHQDYDSSFFEAIENNNLEKIQEYDAKINQEQLSELNKEFNFILKHYQKLIDAEVDGSENKKIYKEVKIYDEYDDLFKEYSLESEDEIFLNDYQNQISQNFENKRDEIKAKYLKKYQQENNINNDVNISNFTLSFIYFQNTL
jgi:uncharacterized protein YdeI (YjbR/CyaY-like superfamily)